MVMVDDGDGSGQVRIWWFLPGKCSTGLGKRVCFTAPKIKRWTIRKLSQVRKKSTALYTNIYEPLRLGKMRTLDLEKKGQCDIK